MDNTIKLQLYMFLTSVYGGLIAGIAYDIYRANRYYFKPKKAVTVISDFIFWVGIALIFSYILIRSNWMELRGYIFIGFFLGGFVYLKSLSKIVLPLLIKTFKKITFLFKKIISIMNIPLKYIKKVFVSIKKKQMKMKRIFGESIGQIKKHKSIISKKK